MSDRAESLARRFEQANDEFVAVAARLADDQWHTLCSTEQSTVAALAHHVAVAYPFQIRAFAAIANGAPGDPLTWDWLANVNAAAAAANAACDRAGTVGVLRDNAARAAAAVRTFDDVQLSRTGRYIDGLPALTIDQWLRHVLIGHITSHLASIRAALDLSGTTQNDSDDRHEIPSRSVPPDAGS
jgi:uncharacterized damage-inducible protein DinB